MADPFRMTIDGVFVIRARGMVVTGRIESGSLGKGDRVRVSGHDKPAVTATVSGIERLNPPRPENGRTGLLLRGLTAEQVEVGMVVETQDAP